MALKDIKAGTYTARAISGRFIEAATGKMALEVAFKFENPETKTMEILSRQFWLSKDAIAASMETLVEVLGYNGSDDTDENGVIKDVNAFAAKDVSIVVELEESQEKGEDGSLKPTGKFYPKLKWVNSLGGSGYKGVSVAVVKNNLASIGFKGAFLAARKSAGLPATDSKPSPQPEAQAFTADDIPF